MQSFHLKGDLDEVAAAIGAFLEGEGFAPAEGAPDHDPSVRRLALYAEGGWVGLAEEGFATTEWGPVLSKALAREVITLAGECDHAFFTHVFVHDGGKERHAARVPEDVTLDDDGLHRIRPTFLPRPIVVNELGGEENMQAIGEAMGIPRPLFAVYDDDIASTLRFRYTRKGAPKHGLAALFGAELGADVAAALGGLQVELAPSLRAMTGKRSAKTDGPPRLARCAESSTVQGFAGEAQTVHASFLLEDAESARGVSVSLYGDGLALFEPARLRARVAEREWSADPVRREGMVTFALPDLELAQPTPRPSADHLPLEERLRQGMKRLTAQPLQCHPGEVTVWIEGRLLAAGDGDLALTAQIAGAADSADTTDIALVVKPAVRRPLVPNRASDASDGSHALHPAYVEQYEARDVAFGWLAFDASWDEARDVVLQIAREAERVLLEATGEKAMTATAQLRDGKRLTLKKDPWPKVEGALATCADVSLTAGDLFHGAALDIVHQVEGPNLLPTLRWMTDPPPRVWLAWWCPRPSSDAGVRALARLADRALDLALPRALAGVASAQKERSLGVFNTAYETMAGIHTETGSVAWLKEHPRAPGWRVLLPPSTNAPGATPRIARSSAPDPFSYSPADAAEMERLIVPLLER